jgi:NAD(P)-dependent dehydrogenase (short-subunit alcohol dehydrogenase family)
MSVDLERLDGRVALISGGARGIGLAIAREFVNAGAAVLIADCGVTIGGDCPDPSVARTAVAELGPYAEAFEESIASPGGGRHAVERAIQRFGGLDIVVNNAAILRDAFIFKADPADWEAVIRTNLSSAFYLLSAATPHLRERAKSKPGQGRIVNILSSAGFYGNYGQVAYASAKAGLFGLTRVVALDMARSGVTCNAVVPFAATRVTESIKPANEAQAAYKERALKVDARHVARLVAYLASPAAQAVTGQLLGVRGRETFVFSQPRPAARLIAPAGGWSVVGLSHAIETQGRAFFTDATTDLEAFAADPVI